MHVLSRKRCVCGLNLKTSKVLFSLLTGLNYWFGLENREEKYNSMFSWPQNGGSMSTESSELSGEEDFLPTTAAKI